MKKYSFAAIAATAITLLVCLLAVFTQSALLNHPTSEATQLHTTMHSFTTVVIVPAVCTVLLALTLTRKINLGLCGLLTLVNLGIYGGCRAAMSGNLFNASAWFFNAQDVFLRILSIWFAAIAVLGFVEKKTVVWAISVLGLALLIFLQTVVVLALSGTPAAANWLNIVTGGSVVLIAVLAVYDRLASGKKNQGI